MNFAKLKFWKRNKLRKNKLIKTLGLGNKKMPKWKRALFYCAYAFIAAIFILAIAFAWFSKDLPTPSRIANRKPTESTKLYDRTGQTLLYETGDQKRTVVKSDQISNYLKDATIAAEDSRFYEHHGFDVEAIMSAIGEKITGQRSVARGGSTITQQFVKNALLTSDRSLIRKFKELILAIELEFMYSKDDILTMYLNEIPYGNSTAGAEAASKMYFGKPAKDLTIAEAATLAAIPKAPTYYSPYGTHTKELESRKNWVLDRMVETKKISEAEAKDAKKVDTLKLGESLKPRRDAMIAPHFAMYILEEIADKYGEEKIQKEGLKVITSLDYDKQKMAEEAVKNGSERFSTYRASNGALVSVDPKTGQIIAMVGSIDYFNTDIDGNVNVTTSLRQPGSSFKPFSYATLFKKKEYSPSKILFDLQTDFGGGYIPRNFNGQFAGPVTIRSALARSLNIPAIKAMGIAGIDNVIRTAEDMGITSLNDRDRYGLSLAIGTAEVQPLEMASAFGVFANSGTRHNITGVIKITDSKGKVLYEYDENKDKGKQVLDPQIAYEISSILSDNESRIATFGAHSALFFGDRPVAVKTGTTQESKDAWTVGYTPSLATAVWVGNNDPSPMAAGGSTLAGPIFHEYMENALKGSDIEQFEMPKGIQKVEVEKYSNKLPNDNSKEKVTDIFASWQVPKEEDDVNVKVKVCKGDGRLAPDDLNPALVEEKTYTDIHSAMPDNPNWENPVLAWAKAHGMGNPAPTEYCKASDVKSTVSITSPANYAKVSGSKTIKVSIKTAFKVKNVEYFIDNVSIGSSSSSPFSLNYDFNKISSGSHSLKAVVTDENGVKASDSIKIDVDEQSLSISDVNIVEGSDSATITWSTNLNANSKVSYGTNQDVLDHEKTLEDLTQNHSVTISGLNPNTTYYYTVSSSDSNGNSDQQIGSFTTSLNSEVIIEEDVVN